MTHAFSDPEDPAIHCNGRVHELFISSSVQQRRSDEFLNILKILVAEIAKFPVKGPHVISEFHNLPASYFHDTPKASTGPP